MTKLTVELPDELAQKAQAAGMLNNQGIERALREAIRRDAGRKFLEISREAQSSGLPPMTEDEVQAEVDAVRAARRAKRDAAGS